MTRSLVPWNTPRLVQGEPTALITPRQADVLAGICHGHSNRQIASNLSISEDTVKSHSRGVLRSMGARDRAHAAALASSGQVRVLVKL